MRITLQVGLLPSNCPDHENKANSRKEFKEGIQGRGRGIKRTNSRKEFKEGGRKEEKKDGKEGMQGRYQGSKPKEGITEGTKERYFTRRFHENKKMNSIFW
jgi:hypothetical protein